MSGRLRFHRRLPSDDWRTSIFVGQSLTDRAGQNRRAGIPLRHHLARRPRPDRSNGFQNVSADAHREPRDIPVDDATTGLAQPAWPTDW